MKIRDVMKPRPWTAHGDETMADAYRRMTHHGVRHLPVVDGDKLIGILTERDVMAFRAGVGESEDWWRAPVARAMSRPPQTANPDDSVTEVAGRLAAAKIGALPVVERGHLIGLVTAADILGAEVHRSMQPAPPTLATAGANGMPQARVVALRGVERERRTLWFHSDRRSAKFAELQADPRASVLFWSPEDAVEVRLAGRVALHVDDPVAHAAWTHASPLSRSAAQIALAPGTTLHAPTPFESLVQEGDPEMAFSHFAALAFVAEALDWLWLGPRDLRRARLTWIGHDWVGHWIVP